MLVERLSGLVASCEVDTRLFGLIWGVAGEPARLTCYAMPDLYSHYLLSNLYLGIIRIAQNTVQRPGV